MEPKEANTTPLGNEHLPDPEDYDFNDDDSDDNIVYYCYCCQYSCAEDHGGWGCPRCGAIMSEETL